MLISNYILATSILESVDWYCQHKRKYALSFKDTKLTIDRDHAYNQMCIGFSKYTCLKQLFRYRSYFNTYDEWYKSEELMKICRLCLKRNRYYWNDTIKQIAYYLDKRT